MDAVLERFREFDKNGDGEITRHELARVLRSLDQKHWTKQRIDQLLNSVDTSGDGLIDFEEFVAWVFSDGGGGVVRCSSHIFGDRTHKAARTRLAATFRSAYGAAKVGDYGNAMRLIEAAPNPASLLDMTRSDTGFTLLHQLAQHGHCPTLRSLLRLGADSSQKSTGGETAVQIAAAEGWDDAKTLLRANRATWRGWSLQMLYLLRSLCDGDADGVRRHLKDDDIDVRRRLPSGLSLMQVAAVCNAQAAEEVSRHIEATAKARPAPSEVGEESDDGDASPASSKVAPDLPSFKGRQQVCTLCHQPGPEAWATVKRPLAVCNLCIEKLRAAPENHMPARSRSVSQGRHRAPLKTRPSEVIVDSSAASRKSSEIQAEIREFNDQWNLGDRGGTGVTVLWAIEGTVQVLVVSNSLEDGSAEEVASLAHPAMAASGQNGWIEVH